MPGRHAMPNPAIDRVPLIDLTPLTDSPWLPRRPPGLPIHATAALLQLVRRERHLTPSMEHRLSAVLRSLYHNAPDDAPEGTVIHVRGLLPTHRDLVFTTIPCLAVVLRSRATKFWLLQTHRERHGGYIHP